MLGYNDVPSEKALRYNEGKPKIAHWLASLSDENLNALIEFTDWASPELIIPLIEVMRFGAKKYEKDNWKREMDYVDALDSLCRHVRKMAMGEMIDQESHLEHVGHILCNVLFAWHHSREG